MAVNRLANETSPYLLQHAHNPVDWYPWGPEAFHQAEAQDKPIFLSVGYSTCYWCHVMERQCFENPSIAAVMNELFVNIKVDREERPDVDQLYMNAVQVQTHHGGWPMSVFLTPDRQYFYGGTYFPPTDAHGRPGFPTLLRGIHEAWQNRRKEVLESAGQFTAILAQLARPRKGTGVPDASRLIRIIEQSVADFDETHGGFGSQPKFPQQTLLQLLLDATDPAQSFRAILGGKADQLDRQLQRTLDAMMYGGIRDQLGGGFHRYSTDARWLVPHFEIMLYDNAMLGRIYAEASQRFAEPRYEAVARGVFDFVLARMTSPQGAFYTAFDAEVNAQEGAPYLWTEQDIRSALSANSGETFTSTDVDLFLRVHGVDLGPNFVDPHGPSRFPDQNVLYIADRSAAAQNPGLLDRMRRRLLAARDLREQPLLDTKVITSWNGLMIRALATAGPILREPRYTQAAAKAADFLLARHLRDDGALFRTSRDGSAKFHGFLDDYAFLSDGLIELSAATGEPRWMLAARQLAEETTRRFADQRGACFFTDLATQDLPVRQKIGTDSPLPSGNAIAADVFLRLGESVKAGEIVQDFSGQLADHGRGMSSLVAATLRWRLTSASIDAPPIPAGALRPVQQPDKLVEGEAQLKAGRVVIELRIAPGWHIQANPAGAGLMPTSVHFPGIQGAQVIYPEPQLMRGGTGLDSVPVYSGTVRITAEIPGAVAGGPVIVRYQACDDGTCRAPAVLELQIGP